MPATPINVTDLGAGGVNVDAEPYDLADNELRQSQNATMTMTNGRLGSLQTRKGYAQFNTLSVGAPILGGIEAPYQGTTNAPASGGGGGGNPGDSGGTGLPASGTGVGPGDAVIGPGGTGIQGGSGLTTNPAISSNPNLFGGKRRILVGRGDNTRPKQGWYLTSQGFADAAYKLNVGTTSDGGSLTPLGLPILPDSTSTTFISLGGSYTTSEGQRAYDLANGVLYYPENLGVAAASPVLPVIHKLSVDGNSDQIVLTVPDNPILLTYQTTPPTVDAHCSAVVGMRTAWADGNTIYLAVVDKVTAGSNAGTYGRVLRLTGLDSGSYSVTEVYNSLNTNASADTNSATQATVPYILENYLGNLFIGFYRGSAIPLATFCMLRPDGTQPDGWGVSRVNSITTATYGDVTCMKSFNGTLYVGFQNYDPAVTAAVIKSYTAAGVVSTALTPTGGTILTKNYWSSMEIFNGVIYAAWYNGAQAVKIYSSADGITWNAVFTANAGQLVAYNLRADNGYLYAFGGVHLSGPQIFLTTQDGVTWTNASSKFTTTALHGDFTNSCPHPILYGIDQ